MKRRVSRRFWVYFQEHHENGKEYIVYSTGWGFSGFNNLKDVMLEFFRVRPVGEVTIFTKPPVKAMRKKKLQKPRPLNLLERMRLKNYFNVKIAD